jgi:hypothetical protein
MEIKMNIKTNSTINNKAIRLYVIESEVTNIYIIEQEKDNGEMKRFIFDNDQTSAEKKYRAIIKKMIAE